MSVHGRHGGGVLQQIQCQGGQLPGWQMALLLPRLQVPEGAGELCGVSFTRTLIPSGGHDLHDLSALEAHLLSPWALRGQGTDLGSNRAFGP